MSGPERTVVFQLPTVVSGQLVCIEGSVAGRSWHLSAGTFVIGRREGCDLELSDEPGVSKVHCKIVAEGDHYRIIDSESRNGTILNGVPTQNAVLNDGDVVQICGCRLRFTHKPYRDKKRVGRVRNPPALETTEPSQFTPPPTTPPPTSAAEAAFTLPAGAVATEHVDRDKVMAQAQPTEDLQLSENRRLAAPAVGEAHLPGAEITDPDSAPPAFDPALPAYDPAQAAPAAAKVQVTGSTLWSFFVGLFVVLITGGGAYAGLLFVNDGQLPKPPQSLLGSESGTGDPNASDPNAADPNAADPNATDPNATDPNAADPNAADPNAADPNAADPNAADPNSTDPNAADPSVGGEQATGDDGTPQTDQGPKKPDPGSATNTSPPTRVVTNNGRKGRRARRPVRKPEPVTDPAATEPDANTNAAAASDDPPQKPDVEATATVASVAVESVWLPVVYSKPLRKPVRVTAGGRVKTVNVEDNENVKSGQVLAVIESATSSPAQIATKKESIRALKSIVEASGDPEAIKMLNEEEAALKRMRASSRSSKVVAPTAGKLTGFRVKAGETLRSRLVVGFVESASEPSLSVVVSKALAAKIKPGSTVKLRTGGGEEEGQVKGKPKKKGKKKMTVTIVAGGVDLSEVTDVLLP